MNKLVILYLLGAVSDLCSAVPPVTGPLLPRPSNLASSTTFSSAIGNLSTLLDEATSNKSNTDFDTRNGSFSVAITSFSALEDSPVLWDYHYLAPNHSLDGTSSTTGASQYLVGSISKAITDLMVLKSGIDVTTPITQYLPELDGANNSISWNSITIQDLMSHLSGLPQNYGFPEIFSLVPLFEALGFPTLPTSDFPSCGVIDLHPGCTLPQLLSALQSPEIKPAFPPNYTPAYNNIAFPLLGIILERHYNLTYAEIIERDFVTPLNLANTGVSPGNSSVAVIPTGDSSWGADFGIDTPTGGLYSSTDDLSRFLRAILASSASILDDPTKINAWLKPHSLLPAVGRSVGAPWEIYRSTDLLPNQPVDVYAKDGGIVAYSARIALLPQFGVGITCLTAGPVGTTDAVMEALMTTVVPALDAVAREQVRNQYLGTYTSKGEVQGNITFALDDSPGMLVTEIFRNESDILAGIETIYLAGPVVAGELNLPFRAYPAGIVEQTSVLNEDGQQEDMVLEDWRLGLDTIPFERSGRLSEFNRGVFKDDVSSWQAVDSAYYGSRAIDRIVVLKTLDGQTVRGVQLPALRLDLWK